MEKNAKASSIMATQSSMKPTKTIVKTVPIRIMNSAVPNMSTSFLEARLFGDLLRKMDVTIANTNSMTRLGKIAVM